MNWDSTDYIIAFCATLFALTILSFYALSCHHEREMARLGYQEVVVAGKEARSGGKICRKDHD